MFKLEVIMNLFSFPFIFIEKLTFHIKTMTSFTFLKNMMLLSKNGEFMTADRKSLILLLIAKIKYNTISMWLT